MTLSHRSVEVIRHRYEHLLFLLSGNFTALRPNVPKLTNAVHHWWPQTVSKFWGDENGIAHQVSCNGELVSSQPKSFGGIRNDNNIRLGGLPTPWDHSFENTFDKADGAFSSLIEWLQSLQCTLAAKEAPFKERLQPISVSDGQYGALTECLASLIVRSPNFRYRLRLTAEYYQSMMGVKYPVPQSLIGLNARGGQEHVGGAMARRGKFAVLLSGDSEFIFGDGFLHNVSSANNPPHNPRCLIPLTPEIAVLYICPSEYRTRPRAFVMNLTSQEASFVNATVQIYSKRYLFFRGIHPVLSDEFTCDEHRAFQYHKHEWIDALERAMANDYFKSD